jgi:hypothetical protein
VTKACFHRKDVEQPYYDLDSVACLNQPLPPYPLEAWLEFTIDGVPVRGARQCKRFSMWSVAAVSTSRWS